MNLSKSTSVKIAVVVVIFHNIKEKKTLINFQREASAFFCPPKSNIIPIPMYYVV